MNTNISKNENITVASIAKHRKSPQLSCAVIIEKNASGFKLLWKDKSEEIQSNSYFSNACVNHGKPTLVVGQQCTELAFYQLEMPPVSESQIEGIVDIQVETLLPLPADQMQLTFNYGQISGDQRPVTVVAARTVVLDETINDAKELKAEKIFLNCQAIAKAWKELFTNSSQSAVIINVMADYTQVIAISDNRVAHATTVENTSQQELSRLYLQDLRNAIDMVTDQNSIETVSVISSKSQENKELIAFLNNSGFSASESVLNPSKLICDQALPAADICEYLEPIGLSMLAIEPDGNELEICKKLYTRTEPIEANYLAKLIAAAILVLVLLFAFLSVFIKNKRSVLAQLQNPDIDEISSRQEYRKTVATQRWDVLAMFDKLSETTPKGMMLDSFSFKRGQPISIATKANNLDQMFEFEKKLNALSEVSDATITSHTIDQKSKKVTFKMTFNYKKVTRKTSRR